MDKKMSYTVKEAYNYSRNDKIEEWIHSFLRTVGNNIPFSDGLKLQKRYWVGPVLVKLDKLEPCCGPDEDMEYVLDLEQWEARINKFQNMIRSGWDIPPLIASNDKGILSLRDGNHRLEAMRREGIEEYWVIIWDNQSIENINQLIEYKTFEEIK